MKHCCDIFNQLYFTLPHTWVHYMASNERICWIEVHRHVPCVIKSSRHLRRRALAGALCGVACTRSTASSHHRAFKRKWAPETQQLLCWEELGELQRKAKITILQVEHSAAPGRVHMTAAGGRPLHQQLSSVRQREHKWPRLTWGLSLALVTHRPH